MIKAENSKARKARKIQQVDRGRNFGNFGPDAQRLFLEETVQQIAPLCQHVRTYKERGGRIEIADVGGGNGILAKAILAEMGEEYPYLTVDLIDIDESKFPNGEKRIRYLAHDAREPLGK